MDYTSCFVELENEEDQCIDFEIPDWSFPGPSRPYPGQGEVTPFTIRREMEQSLYGARQIYYEMKFLLTNDPREYQVQLGRQDEQNLFYGHPVALYSPGTVLDVYFENETIRVQIEEIRVSEGIVRLKDMLIRPYIVFDPINGDIERSKIVRVMNELEDNWTKTSPIVKDIFEKKKYPGGEPTDGSPLVYQRGVVGCGKTYQLSKDLERHREDGNLQIVSAMNNDALTDAGKEIEDRGIRVVQFTQKDYPYSMEKVFADSDVYKRWKYWANLEPMTKLEIEEKKLVKQRFFQLLTRFVILVTPSKAVTLINMLKLRDQKVDVYVDEAGQMKFSSFCSLLLYKINRLWIYGDHHQNAPFDDTGTIARQSCEMDFYDPSQLTEKLSSQSVAEWLNDMNVPGTFNDRCRRLPRNDGWAVVDFFYREARNMDNFGVWLSGKTVQTIPGNRADLFIPPSLQAYPHMTQFQKDKEASRMWKFFKELVVYTKRELEFQNQKRLAFISPYNHLKNACRELWDYAFKEELQDWDVKFMTSYTVQGATFDYSVFYISSRPTLFVTDRLFLVSISRHKVDLLIPKFSIKTVVKPGLLALLARLGILNLGYKHVRYRKDSPDQLKGRRIKLIVKVRDKERLIRFFSTKTFEFYNKFYLYPFMTHRQQENFKNDFTVGPNVMKTYLDYPSVGLFKDGVGQYKYVLPFIDSENYYLPVDKNQVFFNLAFNGEFLDTKYGFNLIEGDPSEFAVGGPPANDYWY
jgi:hypothetical protein